MGQDAPSSPLKVLCIGNSYTSVNDLPAMVAALAEAAGGRKIEADRHLVGGCTLEKHVRDKKAIDKIRAKKWDVGVLQEQSLRPVIDRKSMHEYARLLDAEIKQQGAKTIFYLTWARRHIPDMQEGADPAKSPEYARAMYGISGAAKTIDLKTWLQQQKDILVILKDHGFNWIRLRVFGHDNGQIVLDFQKTGTAAATNADLANRYLWDTNVDELLTDELVDDATEDNTRWALTDHLNSVRDLVVYDPVTGTVSVVKHVAYDAFGNVTSDSATAVKSLLLYTARPFDADTDLQNNLNRWYDLSTARWLSVDPIGFGGEDTNLYRYVGNGPLINGDPKGLAVMPPMTGGVMPPPGTFRVPSWFTKHCDLDKMSHCSGDIWCTRVFPGSNVLVCRAKCKGKYKKLVSGGLYKLINSGKYVIGLYTCSEFLQHSPPNTNPTQIYA